ncbi:DUF167 domain-containing protein [Pseudophaeobacter sp.]|uniref:DUF167 domain-containing protein n=1 Tax=Pseudophaeobacter sp. TaxID=1971739 RepID=UPI00329A65F1
MGKPKQKDLPDLCHLAFADSMIAVKAVPKASSNAVIVEKGQVKITVTAAPEQGKASEAVRQLLARAMGVAPSHLELRQGKTTRHKLFAYIGPQAQ